MSSYAIPDRDAIHYELEPAENGWVLHVSVPPQTSGTDQAAVFDWLREYQLNVRRLHPHWLTAFRETETGYKLYIQRADSAEHILSAVGLMQSGGLVRDYWKKSLEYAG